MWFPNRIGQEKRSFPANEVSQPRLCSAVHARTQADSLRYSTVFVA